MARADQTVSLMEIASKRERDVAHHDGCLDGELDLAACEWYRGTRLKEHVVRRRGGT